MSASPTPPDPKLVEGLAAYTERLYALLQACVRYQRDDPDAFLWNARRALEVICLLALSAHKRTVWRAGPADGLGALLDQVKREKLVDSTNMNRLELLRNHSNLGVHIRGPDQEDFSDACSDFQHMLPKVVIWLFRESPVQDALLPDEGLWRVLYEIEAGGGVPVVEEPDPVPLAAVPPPPVQAPPALEQPPPRRRWPLALVALLLGGLGGAALTGWLQREAWRPLFTLAARSPSAPVPQAQALVAEPVAPAAAAPPTCPDGMTRVDRGLPQIGQPDRPTWPPPRSRKLLPVEVPAFCLDSKPRAPADLAVWSGEAVRAAQPCKGKPPKDRATCISRDEAAAYCAEVVPGGRLPTLLEWEQLSRSPQADTLRYLNLREWIADNFPPAALNRRAADDRSIDVGMFRKGLEGKVSPTDNVLHSWNQQDANNRWANLGFRCAKDLD